MPGRLVTSPEAVSIEFYSVTAEYGCFSNFAAYPINLEGRVWPTTEHYFQAQKFQGTDHEEAVRLCKTPGDAARMGRSRKLPLRSDWENVKDQVMLDALRAKFSQHEDLKATLLGTGNSRLIEHTEGDRYWGDGGDGSGRNMLGHLRIRDELRG